MNKKINKILLIVSLIVLLSLLLYCFVVYNIAEPVNNIAEPVNNTLENIPVEPTPFTEITAARKVFLALTFDGDPRGNTNALTPKGLEEILDLKSLEKITLEDFSLSVPNEVKLAYLNRLTVFFYFDLIQNMGEFKYALKLLSAFYKEKELVSWPAGYYYVVLWLLFFGPLVAFLFNVPYTSIVFVGLLHEHVVSWREKVDIEYTIDCIPHIKIFLLRIIDFNLIGLSKTFMDNICFEQLVLLNKELEIYNSLSNSF